MAMGKGVQKTCITTAFPLSLQSIQTSKFIMAKAITVKVVGEFNSKVADMAS
jgi:hypothetical protein